MQFDASNSLLVWCAMLNKRHCNIEAVYQSITGVIYVQAKVLEIQLFTNKVTWILKYTVLVCSRRSMRQMNKCILMWVILANLAFHVINMETACMKNIMYEYVTATI